MWVPKDAKFYTDSKSESKTEIKRMTKKLFSKNCSFVSFLKITFYWCTFSQFHLPIWNKHKILRFLIPILTYLREKKNFACISKKIFSVKIGQNGY